MGATKFASRRSLLLLLGTLAGLTVAGAAWIWSLMGSPADVWSPEQARALQAARDAVHEARGSGEEVREESPELLKAQGLANRLEADLADARNHRSLWATRVAAAGLALTIACGLGYLATRGD